MNPPKLDRSLDPTSAATKFYAELQPYRQSLGLPTYNLGQCVEIDADKPGGKIAEILNRPAPTHTSPKYPAPGGDKILAAEAAGWVRRMSGIYATASNTLVYQAHSRTGLIRDFAVASQGGIAQGLLVPALHWPMIDTQAYAFNMEMSTYKTIEDGPEADYQDIVEAVAYLAPHQLNLYYTDIHGNPTGLTRTPEKIKSEFDVVEKENSQRAADDAPLLHTIYDLPYYMVAEQHRDGKPCHLRTGLEDILNTPDTVTPWSVTISFSKSLHMATPGFHIQVVHPKIASDYRRMGNAFTGSQMNTHFASQMTEIFAPENDTEMLQHFSKLKAKYVENRNLFEKSLGSRALQGGANIPALFKLEKDFFGRKVTRSMNSNETHPVNNGDDFVEYMGLEHGVVVVNNGKDDAGNAYIRVSQSPRPEEFAKAMAFLGQGIVKIKEAPCLASV